MGQKYTSAGKKHWTQEVERTVLYKTKSLDGTKPNTNPKTNPNPKLTQILTLFSCFMLFFEHRPLTFSLAKNILQLRVTTTSKPTEGGCLITGRCPSITEPSPPSGATDCPPFLHASFSFVTNVTVHMSYFIKDKCIILPSTQFFFQQTPETRMLMSKHNYK